jgi:SPP1 family holin
MKLNLKGVDKATWVRTITLILVLLNQLATSLFKFKLLPFTDAEINEGTAIVLTIVMSVWAGWRNNSFTKEAQLADEIAVNKIRRS